MLLHDTSSWVLKGKGCLGLVAKAEVREICQDKPLLALKLDGARQGMQRALEKLGALLAQCQPGNGYLRPEPQATEFAGNTNEPGSDFFPRSSSARPGNTLILAQWCSEQSSDGEGWAKKCRLSSSAEPLVARQPEQVNTSLDQETLGQWNLLLRPRLLGLFQEITPLVPLPASYTQHSSYHWQGRDEGKDGHT